MYVLSRIRLFEFTPMSEDKLHAEHKHILTQRVEAENKIAELEQQVRTNREIEFTDEEIRSFISFIKQAMLDSNHYGDDDLFRYRKQILEALHVKVWVNGESFSIELELPTRSPSVSSCDIVSTQL